jgi:anti-sigma regulatory factor (Ser/Thr protein kinase)
MVSRIELKLDGVASDAARARAAVLDLLSDEVPVIVVRDAVLMTSELVSNVVLHAPGPAVLRASLEQGSVRVEVEDSSTAQPVMTDDGPRIVGGHGLRLIADLAADWGVRTGGLGKTVWFVVRSAEPD